MTDDELKWDPQSLARRVAQKDPLASGMVAVLGEYEQQFDDTHGEHGWDWPIELLMIYRSLPPTELADLISETLGGMAVAFGIKPIANLTELGVNMDDGPMLHQFLYWFASQLQGSMQEGVAAMMSDEQGGAPDFIGWGLHIEGYMKTMDKDEKEPEELPRGWIKEHGGTEVRVLMAVDRAGYRYQLQRRRDTSEVTAMVDIETDANARLGGRVLDGLMAVMDASPAPEKI